MGLLDFFRPDWKHSDPDVRKKTLLRERDSKVIIEALSEESDSGVISAVLDNLTTIESLEEIEGKIGGHTDEQISKKLAGLYFEKSLKAKSPSEVYFTKLDTKQISRIARESSSEEVQLAAIDKLENEEAIMAVIQNSDKKVAHHALEKIAGKEQLQKLMKSARSKGTKAAVRKRYDLLFGEEERAQERKEDGSRKLIKILEVLEGMSTLPDWSGLTEDYQKQLERWQSLAEFADEELNERFKEACDNCMVRKADFEKEQAELAEKNRLINERVEKRRKLLQDLLADTETLQENASQLLADYKGHWEAVGEVAEDSEKEIARKFEKAVKSFDSKQEVLRDVHEKKEEVKQQVLEISQQAQQLKEETNAGKLSKGLNALKKSLSSIPPQFKEELSAELETAANTLEELNTLLSQLQEKAAEEQKALTGEYEKIIETVSSYEESSKENTESVKELQKKWKELGTLDDKEQAKLNAKFQKICDGYFDKVKEYVEEKEWSEFANLSAKENLIKQMAALDAVEDPQELAKQIKKLQEEWKQIGHVPHDKSDEVWERFKSISDKLYERCKAFYEEQDKVRQENIEKKTAICEEAESICGSDDWKATADKLKELQSAWKEIGPGSRKEEKLIWERFRKSCDEFFGRRKEHFSAVDADRAENTAKKENLIAEIEIAAQSDKMREAAQKIKDLQKQWKEIGPAERNKEQDLWKKFRGFADEFFNRRKENFEQAQSKLEENAGVKEEFIKSLAEKLEGLSDESDWTALSQTFKKAQKDFNTMPGAGSDRDKELKKELREVCDKFFDARNEHFDKLSDEDKENLEVKEEFCLKVELHAESNEWSETAEELKKYQAEFKELPSINEKYDAIMFKRFNEICNKFFERRREHFEELDEVRQENLQKKIELCERVEEIAGVAIEHSDDVEDDLSVADMAAELQNAFDNNFGGYEEKAKKPLSFREASQEIRELQAAWKEIGAVPKAKSQQVWERFRKATDAFYNQRRDFYASKEKDFAKNLEVKNSILADLKLEEAKEEIDFRNVKRLQKQWRETGEVAIKFSRNLNKDFHSICDRIYGNKKPEEENEKEDLRI
ncbi:MAG: DUF349 domain-containing protein [Lentisphaeraceae bacterium]|nr:DUF349 domain-containing protein [Lentisphaeraceae bacterium]